MQQERPSATTRLFETAKEKASSLTKKAKEKLKDRSTGSHLAEEVPETSREDAALQGDHVGQGARSHANMQKFCLPGIGRSLCSSCHIEGSACLRWDLSKLWRSEAPRELSTQEQGRLLTNAFNPMPPTLQKLHDISANGGVLSFPIDEGAYEMKNLATDFLIDLCENHLTPLLPLVFQGCSVKSIGSWAQETALASSRPSLDFVLDLPAWISTNKLCVCNYEGLYGTVAHAGGQRVAFETQVHKALFSSIERVVSSTAVARLQQQEVEGQLKLDYSRGVSCNAGADARHNWVPKRVVLNVICHTQSAGERSCALRLYFGVPCQLAGPKTASNKQDESAELFGHLLIGFSEPLMLNLALEDRKRLLSGADSPDHPRLRLVRIVKFLATVGQLLSLKKREISKADPNLSFMVSTAVRQTQRKYEMAEEAYYRSNFGHRFAEVIDELMDTSTEVAYFGYDSLFSSVRKRPLSPTTLKLMNFVRRPEVKQEEVDDLVDSLVAFYESKEAGEEKPHLVKVIDKLLGVA